MELAAYLQIIIIQFLPLLTSGDKTVCGLPPFPREARIIEVRQLSYPVGSTLSYECNVGYINHGEIKAICNQNGSWVLNINCEPVDCGDPGEISHGFRIGDMFTHPNSVQYICDEGYLMNTNESPFLRHCQANKQWSNHLPSCYVINCSIPENPAYGSIMYHEVTYGSMVIYDCGFSRKLIGNTERKCTKNGDWSGTTPQCVEMNCDYPELTYPHGKVKMLGGTLPHDKIVYECDDGTTTEAVCFAQGIWIPSAPLCMTGNFIPIPTTKSPNDHASSVRPQNITTAHPRKKNVFCKWKLFKWMCNLFN